MDTLGDTLSGHTLPCSDKHSMDLYDAAEAGDLERVRVLVEQGADIETGKYGWTPLTIAAATGRLAVVRYLVVQGADMEKTDNWGWTPLIAATCSDHLDVVRYLVERGADIDKGEGSRGTLGRGGWTPLMWTSANNRLEMMRNLLEQGASTDKADRDGETALHKAALKGHIEVAELLMDYGADFSARNNAGQLPIECARNEEFKQAIRDEPQRRRDRQPRKRCVEQDLHPYSEASAPAQQEDDDETVGQVNSKQPAEDEVEDGEVADEDQDSELSSDEDDD